MPAGDPIKLGSAGTSGFTFQSGSSVSTDDYGIQSAEVQGLFFDGSAVYGSVPAEGSSYSSVFGNSYLPAGFLLDFFDGAPKVNYLEGTVAEVNFNFKRIDPSWGSRRNISVDSVVNYQQNILSQVVFWTAGIAQNDVFGFPDPTVSVKYPTSSQPAIGSGGLSSIYALPGSSHTQGFPPVPAINLQFTFVIAPGGTIGYWDGSAFQSYGPVNFSTTFYFDFHFLPNPRGWQLTKVKYDTLAAANFFAVEEQWRNFYSFQGATFVGHVP